jgi:type I restriction enzyme S subunit
VTHVRLADVAEINPRVTMALRALPDHDVAFLPMDAVSEDGTIKYQEQRASSAVLTGYTLFRRGDVILAKITPCMENGKAAYLDGLKTDYGAGSTEFHVLRPGPKLDGRFLFYMIWNPSFRRAAEKRMTGSAGQKRVPTDFLSELKFVLPPLAEQRRIAAILDKADAIRRKRQQALALADEFLRSAFLEMFGDPIQNPYGLRTEPLERLAEIHRGRFSPRPRNDPAYYGGKYPFIQTGDINNAHGYLTRWTQTLNEKGTRVSRSFSAGTVVIAIVGATIGETAILGQETYFPDSVIGISPKQMLLSPEFVEYALRHWKQRFRDQAPETARANINIETLKPIPFMVPALDDQKKFSWLYRRVHREMYAKLSPDDDLFASLSQRAFRGELRNPNSAECS